MLRTALLIALSTALLPAQTDPLHPSRPGAPAPGLTAGWIDITPDPSLGGWTRLPFMTDKPMSEKSQWHVEDGVLVCEGDGGHEWLRYDRELGDFVFQVEWRFTKAEGDQKYNSGVMVRNSADGKLWIQAQNGSSSGGFLFGNTLVKGAPQRFNLRNDEPARVRPAGEWNTYEIRCQGRDITLSVNGEVASEFHECDLPRGYIGLEAEGYRIEFRNMRVKPLPGKVE